MCAWLCCVCQGVCLCVFSESPDGLRGSVADEYAVLVKALWSGQYRSVAPREFRVCTCSALVCLSVCSSHSIVTYLYCAFRGAGARQCATEKTEERKPGRRGMSLAET